MVCHYVQAALHTFILIRGFAHTLVMPHRFQPYTADTEMAPSDATAACDHCGKLQVEGEVKLFKCSKCCCEQYCGERCSSLMSV
jgi:hypothetical protein